MSNDASIKSKIDKKATETAPPAATAGKLKKKTEPKPGTEKHCTDLGNARRLVERHGADLRYCYPWKSWLVWDGRRWAIDGTGEASRRVKETLGHLYRTVARQLEELSDGADDDDPERTAKVKQLRGLLHNALKWEDARRMSASLEVARSEPGIAITIPEMDTHPWLLNVLNGTINLRTGSLMPHMREDLLTKLAPVEYDPDAPCPTWLAFLDRIMDGNDDLIHYLQRVIGYSLTADASEQVLWFFHGAGANGKSTFLNAIREIMGDYAIQAVSDLFLKKKNESHPTERADLFGRRFVATIEVEDGRQMAEALVKQLTGGDKMRARWCHKDNFEFDQTWKFFIAANHKPRIQGTDHGIWRRIKLVPFTVTITEAEKNKQLPQKLREEYPGILAWAVTGCLRWLRDGWREPEAVKAATAEYRDEQDDFSRFLQECCVFNRDYRVQSSLLFARYQEWSGDMTITSRNFRNLMKDKGFRSEEGSHGYWFWREIGLQK